MPVMHVVTFTFHPGAADTVIGDLAAALDEFAPQSKAVWYQHGRDMRLREANADYAVAAVFADAATFQAYMASPQHQRIISELLTPHLQARSAVQFVGGGSRSGPSSE
jgi:Stress responsive A/B Barrel Domain